MAVGYSFSPCACNELIECEPDAPNDVVCVTIFKPWCGWNAFTGCSTTVMGYDCYFTCAEPSTQPNLQDVDCSTLVRYRTVVCSTTQTVIWHASWLTEFEGVSVTTEWRNGVDANCCPTGYSDSQDGSWPEYNWYAGTHLTRNCAVVISTADTIQMAQDDYYNHDGSALDEDGMPMPGSYQLKIHTVVTWMLANPVHLWDLLDEIRDELTDIECDDLKARGSSYAIYNGIEMPYESPHVGWDAVTPIGLGVAALSWNCDVYNPEIQAGGSAAYGTKCISYEVEANSYRGSLETADWACETGTPTNCVSNPTDDDGWICLQLDTGRVIEIYNTDCPP